MQGSALQAAGWLPAGACRGLPMQSGTCLCSLLAACHCSVQAGRPALHRCRQAGSAGMHLPAGTLRPATCPPACATCPGDWCLTASAIQGRRVHADAPRGVPACFCPGPWVHSGSSLCCRRHMQARPVQAARCLQLRACRGLSAHFGLCNETCTQAHRNKKRRRTHCRQLEQRERALWRGRFANTSEDLTAG